MALIDWHADYSVQVSEMDRDHQKLMGFINQLHEAMLARKGNEVLGRILGDLVSYTRTHFATEERLMLSLGYPHYVRHKQVHEELVDKVVAFKRDFEAGKGGLSLDLMRFLKDWLLDHIQKADKDYGRFIQQKTVQAG